MCIKILLVQNPGGFVSRSTHSDGSSRHRSVASTTASFVSPAALNLLLVRGLVHFPSLERLARYQSLARPVFFQSPARSGQLLPRSVRSSVLLVLGFPRLLESVPSPVAEFLRPLEPVPLPVALDSALVRVVPISRLVLAQPPPPWFLGESSIRSSMVPVLASAL